MRRFLNIWVLFPLLAGVLSCAEKEAGPGEGSGDNPDPVGPGGEVVPGLVFKAVLPEGGKISWTGGDKISINGAESEPLDAKNIDGITARFTVAVEESSSYRAVFPSGAFDAGSGGIVFPAVQSFIGGGADPASLICEGETSTRTVSLQPRYSILKITPAAGTGSLSVTGIRAASLDGNKIGGQDYLSLSLPEGGLGFGKPVYLGIPSGEYPEGLRFTIFASDGSRMSYSRAGVFKAIAGQSSTIAIPKYSPTIVSINSIRAVTASSVVLTWSGTDPAGNSLTDWTLRIYGDASCKTQLRSISVRGAMAPSGDDCGLSVGGLEPGSEYWFRVEDGASGSPSEAIPVKMPSSTRVVLPAEVRAGGVVLAEDFRSSALGDDPFSGFPGVTDGVPEDISQIEALSEWKSSGDVSFHPGYISAAGSAMILTPPVNVVGGKNISADITVKAAGTQSALAVFVTGQDGTMPATDNPSKYREVSLSGAESWKEILVSGLNVASGQRIAVGVPAGGQGRLFVGGLTAEAKSVASVFASFAASTSSTLSFAWTKGGSESADAASSYKVSLYADASCTSPVQSYNLAPRACGDGSPRFVFSGLEQGRTYYFRVEDTGSGLSSDIISATTEAFTVRQIPVTVTDKGVVLAEDFSELRWDSDPMGRSAGYKPSGTGSFGNGPGTFVPYGGTSLYLLKQQTDALPSSRLKGWASDSEVYIHPGMLQLGRSGAKGWIFTPEFRIPGGGNATVNVSIDASTVANTASGVWCIAVMDRANANVTGYSADFNHHPDAADTQKIQFFTLDRPLQWQKLSAEGLTLEDGDRIMFGVKGSYSVSGDNCRALVKDLTVEVTDIFAPENPLVFADGTSVDSEADWALRREEIKGIFQSEMYGTIPAPAPVIIDRLDWANTVVKGVNAVREQYRMWFSEDRNGPKIDWLVVRPRNASGPVPVILTLNYWGNHTFIPDPEVIVPDCWLEREPDFGITGNSANPAWRGKMLTGDLRYHYPIDVFLRRGYALVTACYAEVAPDPETVAKQKEIAFTRIYDLWAPRDPSSKDNPMSLGVWGWSLMRAVDMIETLPALAADKIIVTGCSRLGKAALIAGAFDERIALVAPVQTGSGGVPMTKHITPDKESIASETSTYTHWFSPKYASWAGHETEMPFDQHLLLSLVAPRPLLVLGFNNLWFDAYGEFLSLKAAAPVWDFFGKDGSFGDTFPDTGSSSAIGTDLGYARRDGGHGVVASDWTWILDFSDRHLK